MLATVAAILAAVFAFLTILVYRRIEWLTGSMDSHQRMLIRLEVEKLNRQADPKGNPYPPIQIIWWDPSGRSPKFPGNRTHNEPWDLTTVYVGIPREERSDSPTLRTDRQALARRVCHYFSKW